MHVALFIIGGGVSIGFLISIVILYLGYVDYKEDNGIFPPNLTFWQYIKEDAAYD